MLTIAGIPVEVQRKRIKNLHLYVKPPDGHVLVTAPRHMSDEAIARFVQTKAQWLQAHVARFANRPAPPPPQYVTGETLPVWGRPYRLLVQPGSRASLRLCADPAAPPAAQEPPAPGALCGVAVLTVRPGATPAQREKTVREWYRARLTEEITRRLPRWEAATGLHAATFQTKAMTTRWGTCNTKTAKLWFALSLAQKPPECLDYIILHELLHLKERGHNKAFYSLLDFYMPGWRERKKMLRDDRWQEQIQHS